MLTAGGWGSREGEAAGATSYGVGWSERVME